MRSHEAKERFRQARKLYVERRFDESLAILDELRTVFDEYPDLHYLRARCLGKLKRGSELREVSQLLTTRFSDPRGAEILTWFVRRPATRPVADTEPDDAAQIITPSEPLVDTPVEQQPIQPEDATPASMDAEVPEVASYLDDLVTPVPDESVAPTESTSDDTASPPIVFEDAVPAAAAHENEPAIQKRPRPRVGSRRRLVVAALALVAAVAGAGLSSRVFSSAPETADPPERPEPVVLAALRVPVAPSVEHPAADPPEAEAIGPVHEVVDVPEAPFATGNLNATVIFRPDPHGGYTLEHAAIDTTAPSGEQLAPADWVRSEPVPSWKIPLPFKFAFGGIEWNAVFVNLSGTLTFGYAEADVWPERASTAPADPRAIAAAIDARAAAGRERMIAGLWRSWDPDTTDVFVHSDDETVRITWAQADSMRVATALHRDGSIAFRYTNVEPDNAFAGLFPGIAWAGQELAHASDPVDAPDPNVDILALEVVNAPSVVQFALTMVAAVPATVSSGELIHRITLDTPAGPRQFGLSVSDEPRAWIDWGAPPRTLGYERDRNRLYLYLSKSMLDGFGNPTAHAEVVWNGHDGLYDRVDEPPTVPLTDADDTIGEVDLFSVEDVRLGSVYHVFD